MQHIDLDGDGLEMDDEEMALFMKKFKGFLINKKGNSLNRDKDRSISYRNDAKKKERNSF